MMKVLGYVEMKKRTGKVVFVLKDEQNSAVVGQAAETLYLYDDMSKKITADSVGKTIEVKYSKGYNGNAYVSDLYIK